MAAKFVSERNMKFLLYEVFDVESLNQYPLFEDQNRKMYDLVLKAALKLSKDKLLPIFEDMDRNPPEYENGMVKVHPAMREILEEFGEGGWITSAWPVDAGGEGLPSMISRLADYIFQAANMSSSVYIGLTSGAAGLIHTFGTKEQEEKYLPNMFTGKWQGTMALTEPEAGSSLGDLTTMAYPTDEDYYMIKGQKTFISSGDHDAVDNIIHLMLCRIEGAPAGAKGISLFIVPKLRIEENGDLTPNDVVCSGIFHKLGYRGSPIAQLSMGDADNCRGWLVGEPNKGLMYMFQMMNEARVGVGLSAIALTSAAYYASLDYAKSRCQGRKLGDKDLTKPQVPIVEHPDIKRMLLFQRAVSEGACALLMQCCKYIDMEQVTDGDEKKKYSLLLDVLTPVVKSYPSEMGILSISQGVQILGGSGFCDDYPLEQLYRDCRIHPIHEGTTGIQGMDLLGRKVMMYNGKGFELVVSEVNDAIAAAGDIEVLKPFADQLASEMEGLKETTMHLAGVAAAQGPEKFLADATLYLEYFGNVIIAWQWLLQGVAIQNALAGKPKKKDIQFYEGKMFTLRFYFEYELPKTMALKDRLTSSDYPTVDMQTEHFND